MRIPWIVWCVVWLHVSWAVFLLASPATMNCTPIHWLAESFHSNRWVLSAWLFMTAYCGYRWTRRGIQSSILLLPQQIVLVISAGGSIVSAVTQQYADGVIRPWSFIGAGEAVNVMVAAAHTCALLEVYGVLPRWPHLRTG